MSQAPARKLRADSEELSPPRRRAVRAVEEPVDHVAAPRVGERRTVRITGHPDRPRRRRDPASRIGDQPDRVAKWAVLLGVFMVLVAAATARAGEPPSTGHATPSPTAETSVAPAGY